MLRINKSICPRSTRLNINQLMSFNNAFYCTCTDGHSNLSCSPRFFKLVDLAPVVVVCWVVVASSLSSVSCSSEVITAQLPQRKCQVKNKYSYEEETEIFMTPATLYCTYVTSSAISSQRLTNNPPFNIELQSSRLRIYNEHVSGINQVFWLHYEIQKHGVISIPC